MLMDGVKTDMTGNIDRQPAVVTGRPCSLPTSTKMWV